LEHIAVEIGRALRRLRRAHGLTLVNVAAMSNGMFKATSVAGYERGERSITLERFCSLCQLYGVAPDRVLAEILRRTEGRIEPEIDLAALESLGTTESALLSGFARQVRGLRGEPQADTITLRAGDLEVLATAEGRRPEELAEELAKTLRSVIRPHD
jgi:transcriptional regulator with XRE-family HTH domain